LKLLLGAVAVLIFIALFGTRRETPFMRWGIVGTIAGVALLGSAVFFTLRGVMFGIVLILLGAGVYAFGRVVRKESASAPRRTR
jgi:hypothetical protein